MVMSVTLRQLEAFVAVAEHGSYIKAARALGISQPGLTASILRLEDLLGVRLFDRTTRSVALTAAGADFLLPIRRVLGDLGLAVEDLRDIGQRGRGRVVFACLPSIAARLVGPTMRQFVRRYPGVAVKIFDGDAASVARRVRMREADFGISSTPDPDPDIDYRPLLRDRCCAVSASDHPLARASSVAFAELARHPILTLGPATGVRRILDQAASETRVRLDIVCEIAQISTLCGLIATGIGISVLPEASLPVEPHNGIVARPLVNPVIERDLGLVTIKGRALSPAAESFRDLLVDALPAVWRPFTAVFYPRSPVAGKIKPLRTVHSGRVGRLRKPRAAGTPRPRTILAVS